MDTLWQPRSLGNSKERIAKAPPHLLEMFFPNGFIWIWANWRFNPRLHGSGVSHMTKYTASSLSRNLFLYCLSILIAIEVVEWFHFLKLFFRGVNCSWMGVDDDSKLWMCASDACYWGRCLSRRISLFAWQLYLPHDELSIWSWAFHMIMSFLHDELLWVGFHTLSICHWWQVQDPNVLNLLGSAQTAYCSLLWDKFWSSIVSFLSDALVSSSGELQIWMASVPLSFGHRRNGGQKDNAKRCFLAFFSHLLEALVREYIGRYDWCSSWFKWSVIDFSLISDSFLMNVFLPKAILRFDPCIGDSSVHALFS